jgi:hypothetical protein
VGVTEDQTCPGSLAQRKPALERDLRGNVNFDSPFQIDTPSPGEPARDPRDPQTLEGRSGIFKRDRTSQNRLWS